MLRLLNGCVRIATLSGMKFVILCQASQLQKFLKCAKYKRMSFKDMTVILIIDRMQNALINDNNGRDKI